MGEVYKARDTRLDRTVAIKVLPAQLASDPQFRERFEREARAVAALNHPHICTLHDIGTQDGVQFLVMEYLDGETLADRLKKGPLPLGQALQYAIQMASALDAAHRVGITHRDLKPGNVMVTKGGTKLLDFGLAKTAPGRGQPVLTDAPTMSTPLTGHGTVLGTLQYMAPEQLEGQSLDGRTDIFAFGAVLYEMVTGKKAFERKTHASLIGAILKDSPPAIATLQPLTPPALDRVVNTCLAKDPDDRWQTARDLLRELKWIAEGAQAAFAPTMTAAAVPSRMHGRERVAWIGAIVAFLAASAFALIAFGHAAPLPPIVRFDVSTAPTSDSTSFALSSDGSQLVFVATADGVSKLWLRSLDRTTAQPLAGTDGATYPFWAPSSSSIGFFANSKLKRLDLAGGLPQTLADAPLGRGGTWSQDDVIVFAPSVANPLMRVAATGGVSTPVTRLDQGYLSNRSPQFLPDGRQFIFSATNGGNQPRTVYLASLDGGLPKRLFQGGDADSVYAQPGYLLTTEQGLLIARRVILPSGDVGDPITIEQPVGRDGNGHGAFSVSGAGVLAHRAAPVDRRQLVWIDRTGKRLGTVGPVDDGSLLNPALAPDQRRVAVSRTVENNSDVWILDRTRDTRTRITVAPVFEDMPVWSPDSTRLIFRRGVDLYERLVSGGSEQRVFSPERAPNAHDWSLDGQFLLYSVLGEKTGNDLWVLPLTGDHKPFAIANTSSIERNGQFSPDVRWVAYDSNESGRFEVYVQAFPGPGWKGLISTAGGSSPRWRRDGKELFYLASDGTMMAVPVRAAVDNQSLEVGTITPLFRAPIVFGGLAPPPGNPRQQYDVAADGLRFLINVTVDDVTVPPITIVLNWQSTLGAREKR